MTSHKAGVVLGLAETIRQCMRCAHELSYFFAFFLLNFIDFTRVAAH